MLTDWETYRPEEKDWLDFRKRILEISSEDNSMKDKKANSSRSAYLGENYLCGIFIYDEMKEIIVQYVGLEVEEGRKLLEEKIGLELIVKEI